MVDVAEAQVRECLEADIPAGDAERQGALGSGDGLVVRAHDAEIGRQIERDLSQPMRVVQGGRQAFGLAQTRQAPLKIPDRPERRAQGELEVKGLLLRGALLGQMREGLSACSKDPTASR